MTNIKFDGKILLVDDEAHVRTFLSLVLNQLGKPKLFEAGDGHDAIEIYRRVSPDLVLLDVNMPIKDGIETLRELMEINPNCRVIMLTSLVTRQTVEQALQLGAVNYIRKDTPKEEILSTLQQTINECFTAD